MSHFSNSPVLDLKKIYSVWFRHAKRYRNSWLVNCLPPISEPIIYLLAFGVGMGPLVGEVHYQGEVFEYFDFIAPGMIAVGVLFQSFFEGAYGTFVRIRYQLTWQSMLTTPLRFHHIFLGDYLWSITRGSIAGLLTAIVAYSFGVLSVESFLLSLPLIILGSAVFGALGMCAAGIAKGIDQLNVPVFLAVVPMFALCGTYFPRDVLPTTIRQIAGALPLAALVDLLRSDLSPPENSALLYLVLFIWIAFLQAIAYRQLKRKLYA